MDAEDQTLAILSVVAGTRLVYIEVIGSIRIYRTRML